MDKEESHNINSDIFTLLKRHMLKKDILDQKDWEYIFEETECVKDNRGQWDHPGKCTLINSSNITMVGVEFPLLGIDETGHFKLMLPNNNYKFPGKKVFEIPLNGKYKNMATELLKI